MKNEEKRLYAGAMHGTKAANAPAADALPHQPSRGIAGRLRPYRDVRAAFEPWRRASLLAWASGEDAITTN